MRSYGMEVISFADLMCQMTDLLRPRELPCFPAACGANLGGPGAGVWVHPVL